MNARTPPPTVCSDCWHAFHERIEASPTKHTTNAVCWCAHAQSLAVATVKAGAIIRTVVQGPLTEAEATSMLHGFVEYLPPRAIIHGQQVN